MTLLKKMFLLGLTPLFLQGEAHSLTSSDVTSTVGSAVVSAAGTTAVIGGGTTIGVGAAYGLSKTPIGKKVIASVKKKALEFAKKKSKEVSEQVVDQAKAQAAVIIPQVVEQAKAQAAVIIPQVVEQAKAQAAVIIPQVVEQAKAQAAVIIPQVVEQAKAQAAVIIPQAVEKGTQVAKVVATGNILDVAENTTKGLKEMKNLEEASDFFNKSFDEQLKSVTEGSSLSEFTEALREKAKETDQLIDQSIIKEKTILQTQWNKNVMKLQREEITLKFLDKQLKSLQNEKAKVVDPIQKQLLQKKIGFVSTQIALYERIVQERFKILEGKGASYKVSTPFSNPTMHAGVGGKVLAKMTGIPVPLFATDIRGIQRDAMIYNGTLKTLEEQEKAIEKIHETHEQSLKGFEETLEKSIEPIRKNNKTLQEKIQEELKVLTEQNKEGSQEALNFKKALEQTRERERILANFLSSPVISVSHSSQENQAHPLTMQVKIPKDLDRILEKTDYNAAKTFEESIHLTPEKKKEYEKLSRDIGRLIDLHHQELKPDIPEKSTINVFKELFRSFSPSYTEPKKGNLKQKLLLDHFKNPSLSHAEKLQKIEDTNKELEKDVVRLEEKRDKFETNPQKHEHFSKKIQNTKNIIEKNKYFLKDNKIRTYRALVERNARVQ